MENMNRVQDFVTYLRNPVVLQRILNLNNINPNLLVQILLRANKRKNITAYNLLKARVNEEGFLVNVTDGFIIGKSAEIIWKNFTAAEKSIFITSASQIRSRLAFC
ncbi:14934_t:CDS:1 [Racocetra fulgida]|uniref:14934_t:CDS:1 n=1 Tax=Racocetra fulgida TaxID=60492 RepID=A0A9N9AQH3_9GLOM|nr:14934_t:CDS:1 [Racocetra fulgida]